MPDQYSERDAADLLRRAALLQAKTDHARGPGLSLEEVKRAAGAAGIDARFVEQAALGAGDDVPTSAPFLGIQTGARRTRIVSGRVSDAEWGKMVATLRRQLGGTGVAETIGDVREWRRDPYHILIEPEGENTRITASGAWRADTTGAIALTTLLMMMALLMITISITKSAPEMLVLAAMFGVPSIASGAFMWPRLWAKGPRIEGKIDRVLDTMEGLAGADERAEVLAKAPLLSPEASGESRMDASLLDAHAPASGEAAERQRLRE